jgi:hypothetical protein
LLAGGSSRSLVYRTYPLNTKNEKIRRALVTVHGASRDADNYFRTATAAALLADALEDTIIIAPHFASNSGSVSGACRDQLETDEVNWPCGGNSWRSGGTAANNDGITSFDFADEILRRLARKDIFPNLKIIVVAGHSAGGQFVTRYEMANKVHDSLGVQISYLIANPSSYAYLDSTRPAADGKTFGPFADARNCTTYDQWPYGLQHRTGYVAMVSEDSLKKQLTARPVTYLVGELDVLPLGGFDSSCPAMAQGPTRLARGRAFAAYVNAKYGGQQKALIIPLCGHNGRCMFTAEMALPLLFPPQ